MNWYGVLKVAHVLSAIVWIGGGAALSILMARLLRGVDRAALAPVIPQLTRTMQAIGGPAAGLLLLTGIAMVLVGRMTFRSLWIGLGFGSIILLGSVRRAESQSKRMAALEQAAHRAMTPSSRRRGRARQASMLLTNHGIDRRRQRSSADALGGGTHDGNNTRPVPAHDRRAGGGRCPIIATADHDGVFSQLIDYVASRREHVLCLRRRARRSAPLIADQSFGGHRHVFLERR
jgi:uncharacterized membrane protein